MTRLPWDSNNVVFDDQFLKVQLQCHAMLSTVNSIPCFCFFFVTVFPICRYTCSNAVLTLDTLETRERNSSLS
jgi:hypothetical protein